jgi:hypothetical protein
VNTALVIAVVALAGSVVTAIVSTFGLPVIEGRRDARKVLDTYGGPLVDAAYELQARLYNVLSLQFVDRYLNNNAQDKKDAAIHSTLYVFAQFFGSRELIRGEIQYLRFSRHRRTRRVSQLIWEIGEEFLADSYGPQFMLWRVEQRGLGERMISSANGRMTCMGYAARQGTRRQGQAVPVHDERGVATWRLGHQRPLQRGAEARGDPRGTEPLLEP